MKEPERPAPGPKVIAPAPPSAAEPANQETLGHDLTEVLLSQQSRVVKDINRNIESE
jgi:hypothetical protein